MLMRRTWLAAVGALSVAAIVFGFIIFANAAMRTAGNERTTGADGIVVLTGAPLRIQEGMRLLNEGKGRRLLISGVNRVTKRGDIKRLLKGDADRFDCCVDLGYEARNTRGNAQEIAHWAADKRFSNLIVVTSNYHMPRAMAEVGIAFPDAQLAAHGVVPEAMREGPWWLNGQATKLLAYEYVKFLPAVITLGASRIFPSWTGQTTAGNKTGTEPTQPAGNPLPGNTAPTHPSPAAAQL
ncbi:MAG: YdcF family protein [Pseudomonadota bacterium]